MPHTLRLDDLWQRTDLSSTAKLVAEALERNTARRYGHSFLSSESLGRLVGRSVRTAQLALAELKGAGLVAVKVCRRWLGRLIQSGHVIRLLWRSGPPFFGATGCARPAQSIAPESIPPKKRKGDGGNRLIYFLRPLSPPRRCIAWGRRSL